MDFGVVPASSFVRESRPDFSRLNCSALLNRDRCIMERSISIEGHFDETTPPLHPGVQGPGRP